MSEHDFLLGPPSTLRRPLHAIALEVCQKHQLRPLDLLSKRRDKMIVFARFEFCFRARNESSATYPEIGKFLNRDHTSIMSAVKRYPQISAKLSPLLTDN